MSSLSPEQSPGAQSERRPRGGKRPGAGAPRGNMNALRSGHYSARIRAVARGLSSIPEIRDMLLAANRRQQIARRKAERVAVKALNDLFTGFPDPNNQTLPYLIGDFSDTDPRKN